jgi:hypothetical protein
MAQIHADIAVTVEEQRIGEQLLHDICSVTSMNAFLFNHLRHLLLPPGTSCPLPLHTKINTSKPMKDGRALELFMGILFHCMGYRVLECCGGPGDGGVDVWKGPMAVSLCNASSTRGPSSAPRSASTDRDNVHERLQDGHSCQQHQGE